MKSKLLRAAVSYICIYAVFFVGCAGSRPNPVDRYTPGDEKRSCRALMAEMASIDQEVVRKGARESEKDFWNIVLFVAGVFVIIPFFFMDIKKAEEVEINALKERKTNLKIMFADKNCEYPSAETIEEIKAEAKEKAEQETK